MKLTTIEAIDIQDAWFQCIDRVLDDGFKYTIEKGSYVGQTRLEFDFAVIQIRHPYSEPYDSMLPQIQSHLGIPNPVADGYVEQYLPYLMTGNIKPGEQYTYGFRIHEQIYYWIRELQKAPNTNQAILQVAQPDDYLLPDLPCLRHIDMRIKAGQLIFSPYFRSWDLWGGLPANLAGIAVLQKFMADEIGVGAGPIVASSKGLHLYGYVEDLAKLRTGRG